MIAQARDDEDSGVRKAAAGALERRGVPIASCRWLDRHLGIRV